METAEVDVVIIGAGVIGLAMAEAFTRKLSGLNVVIVERHARFGQEISSHHSEVIHAGIYYKKSSNKARYCVLGNQMLYEFCKKFDVPHRNCGKYIVATRETDLPILRQLSDDAVSNGATANYVDSRPLATKLANPNVLGGLWSPTTGIVDSHALMVRLEQLAQGRGAILLYRTEFVTVEDRTENTYLLKVQDPEQGQYLIRCRAFINCAGLGAARIARKFLPEKQIEIRPCRGRYFSLSGKFTDAWRELIYPVPDPAGGLGVHITFDLAGKSRLGPDVDWSASDSRPDDPRLYDFTERDQSVQEDFYLSGKRLIPQLEPQDIAPDYIGIRPKLFESGAAVEDFRIYQSGPCDWHLLGIESPGLTSTLALADHVSSAFATTTP
jgi:L-2-hydroxyglutarate oxidase LhgO